MEKKLLGSGPEGEPTAPNRWPALSRAWETSVVWAIVVLAALLTASRIVALGFFPIDDALRHAAQAVHPRPWTEILVLRSESFVDSWPGWHAALRVVHTHLGLDAQGLVVFSVVGLLLLFVLVGAAAARTPESWLVALVLVSLATGAFVPRLAFGRPFVLSSTMLVVLLALWRPPSTGCLARATATLVICAAATWIHGTSWYLVVILPLSLAAVGRAREALWSGWSWLLGSALGASLTGDPIRYLWQQIEILIRVMTLEDAPFAVRQVEFEPSSMSASALIVVAVVLLWRRHTTGGDPLRAAVRDPVFLLVVASIVGSYVSTRLWLDIGAPVLALWLASEIADELEVRGLGRGWRRIAAAAACGAVFFVIVSSDVNRRWTSNLGFPVLDSSDPEVAELLPDPGGVFYSANMGLFYSTYFANPEGQWRYAVGFEPTLMRDDDYAVWREARITGGVTLEPLLPWIRKMRTEDRLVIFAGGRPAFDGLEWSQAAQDVWVGRVRTPGGGDSR